jgi:SPP1 family predicted phage head-tail adaptor
MFPEVLRFQGCRETKATIEKPTAAQDSFGAPSTGWTAVAAAVPVRVRDLSGQERYADQQIEGISRFEVLLRYIRGITNRMRVSVTNDGATSILDIENVNNLGMKNRWLVLSCKSGVNRG